MIYLTGIFYCDNKQCKQIIITISIISIHSVKTPWTVMMSAMQWNTSYLIQSAFLTQKPYLTR